METQTGTWKDRDTDATERGLRTQDHRQTVPDTERHRDKDPKSEQQGMEETRQRETEKGHGDHSRQTQETTGTQD